MKKSEYDKLIELSYTGGHLFAPVNQNSFELCDMLGIGETVLFDSKTPRDIKFHRCYFTLIGFIYGYLPEKFQRTIPKSIFYKWLQHLKGEYEIVFEFADGSQLIEYESLSFGKMSQERFEAYIKEQLPWIYENVLGKYYKDEVYSGIVDTIEKEFEKFLIKL